MTIIPSSKKNIRQSDKDCNNCEEKDNATQRSINIERQKYCDELYTSAGEVSKAETNYSGQTTLYENKKCMFVWTEGNYRRLRNTEICIGTELVTSNDLIKESVGNYVKWGIELSTSLKNIFKYIKDVKTKVGDLRDAADKLKNCTDDICNCTQMTILTGEVSEKCADKKLPQDRPPECSDANDILKELLCMPGALKSDADSLFQSASDVIGIQVFSNLGTLEPLQKTLSDESKTFEKHILEIMKARETDMKKVQEELVKIVQETTKSASGLYSKRNDFEGLMCTTKFICCPACDCVVDDGNCIPRLDKCKQSICDICDEVKETFCDEENCIEAKAS